MTVNVRKFDQATILDLNGPLKLGDAAKAFQEAVQKTLDSGNKNLAINMAGVPLIDSSGIGALLHAYTSAKQAGGKLTLFAVPRVVRQMLKMVRLDTVMELAEDEVTALSGF